MYCVCSQCGAQRQRRGCPLFSAHRPCPGGLLPAFSPSTRRFQRISQGQIWTTALQTVGQEIWRLNQPMIFFLGTKRFLLISTYYQLYYLSVLCQEQWEMRTFGGRCCQQPWEHPAPETLDAGRAKGLTHPRPWTKGGWRATGGEVFCGDLSGGHWGWVCPQNAVQPLGPSISVVRESSCHCPWRITKERSGVPEAFSHL